MIESSARLPPAAQAAGPASGFGGPRAQAPLLGRWVGWRLRLLVAITLASCLAIFGLARWLAQGWQLPLTLTGTEPPVLVVAPNALPGLGARSGATLRQVVAADGRVVELPAAALRASPRWQLDDALRAARIDWHQRIERALAQGAPTLEFDDGSWLRLAPPPRGYGGLGAAFWAFAALALLVTLTGAVVALSRPQRENLLYLVIALCQGGNLLALAANSMPGTGLPATLVSLDLPLRATFDLVSGAAIVHLLTMLPTRGRHAATIAAAAWVVATLLILGHWASWLQPAWWWVQLPALASGAACAWIVTAQHPRQHPVARLVRRFIFVALAAGALITLIVAAAGLQPQWPPDVASSAAHAWHLLAAGLLFTPLLARSRQAMREFALLAGISLAAASLDLLFVFVFSLAPFTSLALVVFVALGVYAGIRQWLLERMVGGQVLTTERIFEQLYRAARDVQTHPHRHAQALANVLRELFEPLEVMRSARPVSRARVAGSGSALLVPLPPIGEDAAAQGQTTLMLRFARRGQRIFTREDARLADRVVEQLRRAVEFDLAVERGRMEERLRIAQDLHDDIGARLLTLIYQAPNPEMEDYVRHTLKDLKTLTRGLAASEHRLSHAIAEWKADIAPRLAAAGVELAWSARFDDDALLSMVQWSSLTRVLRELVSNAIHHAHASRVEVQLALARRELTLVVTDDGQGHHPQDWAHGLGIGGVRKRVKQLGGEVAWRPAVPHGIVCEVRVPDFAGRG